MVIRWARPDTASLGRNYCSDWVVACIKEFPGQVMFPTSRAARPLTSAIGASWRWRDARLEYAMHHTTDVGRDPVKSKTPLSPQASFDKISPAAIEAARRQASHPKN